ncbi:MAG: hypothetical protein AAGM27_04850, partial [Cyanobacteria bacterium J06554_3]
MTSAEDQAGISLNLSALAEENMGSAIAELEIAAQSSAQENEDDRDSADASSEPIVLPPASEASMQD